MEKITTRTLGQIELPSSNDATDTQRFIVALNQALEPSSGVEVRTAWRGNRRYLSLQRS